MRTPRLLEEEETIPILPWTSSSPSSDVEFETPNKAVVEIQDDDNDDADVTEAEEKVKLFSRKHYGEIASSFLSSYLRDTRLLDTQCGIRREGDNFKIGNATVTIDNEQSHY